jgi:hypothetical protein
MTATSSGADLQQLMMIAELYARKLVADAGPPARALMLERDGELDFVVLPGQERDAADQARHLLARHQATSAALLFEVEVTGMGIEPPVFCIMGESHEGTTATQRYRVRRRGRRRRLMPLTVSEGPEVEGVFRPLFPVHLRPPRSDAVPAEPSDIAIPASLPSTGVIDVISERIVAA